MVTYITGIRIHEERNLLTPHDSRLLTAEPNEFSRNEGPHCRIYMGKYT